MAEEEIKLVAYTPELQQAVNKVLGLDRGVRYPRGGKRNTLTETVAAGSYEYNGYFKITDASEDDVFRVKVIDGKDPEGTICGVTDIGEVPAGTVENPAGKYVALVAKYDEEQNAYEFELVAGTYNELRQRAYFILAEVDANRTITQLWQDGVINFGERYVI